MRFKTLSLLSLLLLSVAGLWAQSESAEMRQAALLRMSEQDLSLLKSELIALNATLEEELAVLRSLSQTLTEENDSLEQYMLSVSKRLASLEQKYQQYLANTAADATTREEAAQRYQKIKQVYTVRLERSRQKKHDNQMQIEANADLIAQNEAMLDKNRQLIRRINKVLTDKRG